MPREQDEGRAPWGPATGKHSSQAGWGHPLQSLPSWPAPCFGAGNFILKVLAVCYHVGYLVRDLEPHFFHEAPLNLYLQPFSAITHAGLKSMLCGTVGKVLHHSVKQIFQSMVLEKLANQN